MNKAKQIKGIAGLILSTAMLLSVAGCSAGSTETTAADTSAAISGETSAAVTEMTAETTPIETTAPAEKTPIRVAGLKGPTGIGMVGLMASSEAGTAANQYTFTMTGTPDDIVAMLSSGTVDIAALPTNLAAVLYQKTNKSIQIMAVNTLGVLYILENGDTVHSMADLAGKDLYATGQASVPEYVLNDLLANAGVADSVSVTYKTEHAELATLAASGKADLVMLPEPFVTTVLKKNPDFRIALNLTDEWKKAYPDSELAMGCIVVTTEFANAHPEAVEAFLKEYKASADSVVSDPAQASELVVKYGIMADAKLAEAAIPNCNIVMIEGEDMKTILVPFYQTLFDANPKSVGGTLPDDLFYYVK